MSWQVAEEKESRSRRIALWIVRLIRFASVICFLYGGGLAAKDYAPVMMSAVKSAMKGEAGTDPMALYKMERAKQEAFEKEKEKARQATAAMAVDDGSGSNIGDDPYALIAGGQKPKKSPESGVGSQDEKSGNKLASAAGGPGANGLWEKGKMGNANFNQSPSGGAGAAGSGMAGAGGFGGASGGSATGGSNVRMGARTGMGEGADMSASAAGGTAGGKVARNSKRGITRGSKVTATQGGAMAQLRKAGGFEATKSFNTHSAGGNASQYQTGQMDMAFAGKTDTGILQAGGVGEIGGVVMSNPITPETQNPNNNAQLAIPDNEERAEDHDSMMNAINALILTISVLGIALAVLGASKDPFSSTAFTVGYIAGWVMLLTTIGLIAALAGKSENAKGIATGYLGPVITLFISWALLAVDSMRATTTMGFVGGAIQGVMKMMTSGDE